MATFSMSTLAIGSDEVKDYCCSTCEELTIEVDADVYCETCLKFYCRKCIHHHSQLFKTHSPYGRNTMNKWPASKKLEDFLLKCAIHKDEPLTIFCDDHSQLCCANCAFLNHRQCAKVTLIAESVKKYKTKDLQRLATKLLTILDQMKSLHEKQEASIQSMQGSYDEQLQLVRETQGKINAVLDKIETNTLNEMKATLTSLLASPKLDIENCTRLKNDLKRHYEAIQDIIDKSKQELSFIASKKSCDIIQQSESFLKKNSLQNKVSIAFLPNSEMMQYMSTLSCLGRIEHTTETLSLQRNPNEVLTLKGKSEYDVSVPSDSQECDIRDIFFLPDGQVLVADSYNKKVKLLNKQYQVVSHCDVFTYPQGICQISPGEVAVTMNDLKNNHGVQFIAVSNAQLVTGRKLQIKHYCYGIAHNQGHMFITSGTALYKYLVSGKLESRLYEDKSDDWTVRRCALGPTGDKLYISNKSQNKLLTLAMDGSVLATCTIPELLEPSGVHVTPAGQVLVCGWKSQNIIQVDSEGRRKLATLASVRDGVRIPWSVCYNSNTSSIIVGQRDNNNILVFKVK